MTPSSRVLRRTSLLAVAEAVLLSAVLCATLALVSVPATRAAGEAPAASDLGPSPAVSAIPDPSALLEPSPTPDPTPTPSPDPTLPPEPGPLPAPSIDPSASPDATPSDTPGPSSSPVAGSAVHVDHVWIDTIDPRSGQPLVGTMDAAQTGVARGTLYVVRFQVVNDGDLPMDLAPAIEFAAGASPDSWALVPAVNPVDGLPLYSSSNVRRGQDPAVDPIAVADLRLSTSSDPAATPVAGLDHAGVNPGPSLALGPHSFTELAFTVRATADAAWLTTYLVRLSSAGQAIAGPGVATLTLRNSPPVVLSPGQRSGVVVPGPFPSWPLAGDGRTTSGVGTAPGALNPPTGPGYVSPHGPYTLVASECAACHAAHTAQGRLLLVRPAPQSTMCFTCHDGSGAVTDVAAQYADPSVPPNNASTGSYYSHPATTLDNHTTGSDASEFAGVLNRHSACADCHSPHRADGTAAVETSQGWTASGSLIGASGVAVVNGPAASPPTSYTPLASVTFEYQLCFKCHSGYTQLPAPTGPPSTWAIDKAVELNPANLSYHPVEAAGKNGTTAMANSLASTGTSPYKLWVFTTASTIRCVSCHGDPRVANPASPPAAGTLLAPHAVANRGMLIQPYRDRILKGSSEPYNAADFALCYVCHAEGPFVDTSQNPRLDTNFPYHGTHTAAIASFTGPGGSIDTDGAGHGNALCAECHFRIHGTTNAVDGQPATSRLVNFAPDVQPYQGTDPLYANRLVWDATTHTCTLTCHGVDHAAWSY